MSVITVDSEGNFHKKIYIKDGIPQKVFKDGKLIFPDFVMINSGGHNRTGEPYQKCSPYGGDFGCNSLFEPYSSRDVKVGGVNSELYITLYYTDTFIYGDGCFLTDTYNLNGEVNGKRIHYPGQNTHPLSSCGDAICIDGKVFDNYFSQLNFSSNLFLYCNVSADTDTISGYMVKNNIPPERVDWFNSYEPKINFGVCYNYETKNNNGEIEIRGNGNTNNDYEIKFYKRKSGSSYKIDIECLLNSSNNTYIGMTNKYFIGTRNAPQYIDENVASSMFKKTPICGNLNNFGYNVGEKGDKYYITPNFEYIPGRIKLTGYGDPVPLYVNSILSGEWGVSFEKDTPKKINLCEDANGELYNMNHSNFQSVFQSCFLREYKDGKYVTVVNSSCYPMNNEFIREFYDYSVKNGDILASTPNVNEGFPVGFAPDINDYYNGLTTTISTPNYLWTNMRISSPSSIEYWSTNQSFPPNYYPIKFYSDDGYTDITSGGTIFEGLNYAIPTDFNYKSKMLLECEFEAKLKFKSNTNQQLPVIIGYNRYDISQEKIGSLVYTTAVFPSSGIGEYKFYNKNIKNLYGESDYDWDITNEWRKYKYTADVDYVYSNEDVVYSGPHGYKLYIPYLAILGNCFRINEPVEGHSDYITPYEVRNVTTNVYI